MRSIIKPASLVLLMVFQVLAGSAQNHKADDIIGVWLNQEATGKIQIFKEGGKYFGKLVWLRVTHDSVTGLPRTDKENPDAKLKTVPLIGLVNMKDFTFKCILS
jgi:uncharacterized protein (DUF2147 family)